MELQPHHFEVKRDIDGSLKITSGDFVYVTLGYDYRYTSNAEQHALADRIVDYLNGNPTTLVSKGG